jgi:hypothetical protein
MADVLYQFAYSEDLENDNADMASKACRTLQELRVQPGDGAMYMKEGIVMPKKEGEQE